MKVFKLLTAVTLVLLSRNLLAASVIYDAEKSVARNWNEAMLGAIRIDFARPTVHARNLFHASAAMYDAWAIYDTQADPYFLGNTVNGFTCGLSSDAVKKFKAVTDKKAARNQTLSFAMYRLLTYRFKDSPGKAVSFQKFLDLMTALGYDTGDSSIDYSSGSAAALGNYLAQCVIDYGLQDGANEANTYKNIFYQPVNGSLRPTSPGVTGLVDPNRWQPLELDIFVDQAGNVTSKPPFLGAEWGGVSPFALKPTDKKVYQRDGHDYVTYHDPGSPATLTGVKAIPAEYQWNHSLVAIWSGHLDPTDGVTIDASPAGLGNTDELPADIPSLQSFFKLQDGGVKNKGRALNPVTGQAYSPQIVLRGDYTRVLAEFWADGPTSETPPGHWYTILNKAVNDHPLFEKRFMGSGPVLDDLEWDVKSYFALGGAVHDAAITAWGLKGWYDSIRPLSAFRYMASLGQSSDPLLPNYNVLGLPLLPGYVESVKAGDPLVGADNEHLGKIKVKAWRGPGYIKNPKTDVAGVGWILAENWWPYQRPTFVTPPFAGFISGHSTFSRSAAEVLTLLTGNEYFPGGMAEFLAPKNNFLVFEAGPSTDIKLQWATYRDASDQCSLSRIWGGIHPPMDDIPGRRLGQVVGPEAFNKAKSYFDGSAIPDPSFNTAPAPVGKKKGGSVIFSEFFALFVVLVLRRIKLQFLRRYIV